MKPSMVLAAAILFGTLSINPADAQTYRCKVGAKTVYADTPCAANAQRADAMQDNLTEQQVIDRLKLSIKERRERNQVEGQQAATIAQQQQAAALENARAERAENTRKAKCAAMARSMQRNDRNKAIYQDLGMQRSLTYEEQQKKAAAETYWRECP